MPIKLFEYWGKAEETDAEGTSEAIDKFPDWLNDNP